MDKIKINIYNILIFFLVLFKYLINYGASSTILYAILLIVSVVLLISFINKKELQKNEFKKLIVIFAFILIYVFIYKDVNLLISFILALSYPKGDEKKFLKVFFISSIIMYLSTIVMAKFGIISSKSMIRNTAEGIKYRYSLGFSHPNEVFLYFLPIAISMLCIIKNKKKGLLITFIISTILYGICQSRTGYISLCSVYILYLLKEKQIIKIAKIMPIILVILSFVLAKYYGNTLTNIVSSTLSGRPYFWNVIISNSSPFTLFGINKLEDVFLDSFYLSIIYRLGIFGFFIYTFIYYYGINKIKDKNLLIACIVFAIYGFSEGNTIIGSINFTIAVLINRIIFYKGEKDVD